MTDVVTPSAVIQGGKVVSGPDAEDPRKDYPGQGDPCRMCGAVAEHAPEGLYGIHRRLSPRDEIHKFGDPVWEFSHCWKCGYRNEQDPTAANQAQMFRQFQAWLQENMKDSQNHPTASIEQANPDEVAQLRAALAEVQAKLANQNQS